MKNITSGLPGRGTGTQLRDRKGVAVESSFVRLWLPARTTRSVKDNAGAAHTLGKARLMLHYTPAPGFSVCPSRKKENSFRKSQFTRNTPASAPEAEVRVGLGSLGLRSPSGAWSLSVHPRTRQGDAGWSLSTSSCRTPVDGVVTATPCPSLVPRREVRGSAPRGHPAEAGTPVRASGVLSGAVFCHCCVLNIPFNGNAHILCVLSAKDTMNA